MFGIRRKFGLDSILPFSGGSGWQGYVVIKIITTSLAGAWWREFLHMGSGFLIKSSRKCVRGKHPLKKVSNGAELQPTRAVQGNKYHQSSTITKESDVLVKSGTS